jgi:hypothetical protein
MKPEVLGLEAADANAIEVGSGSDGPDEVCWYRELC